MRNNKVVLSLVVASIAAMASVPELLKQEKSDNSKKDVIDLKGSNEARTEEQQQLSADVKGQMDTIWSKKTPATKVGESVDVLVDNYGTGDKNIKEKIYEDLKLAQYTGAPRPTNQDSTNIGAPGGWGSGAGVPHGQSSGTYWYSCHGACHGACHSACHGARGWRKTNT